MLVVFRRKTPCTLHDTALLLMLVNSNESIRRLHRKKESIRLQDIYIYIYISIIYIKVNNSVTSV